ncbi:ATP-dependent DNA helicase MER3 [Recurvomyces mirabilis]|nr:ATP-dependent DNA helicase MER3 [Recurvomyces mirabilis]
MADRIFAQLDQLERGARLDDHHSHDTYTDNPASYAGQDSYGKYCAEETPLQYDDEHVNERPMGLDSFDEALLRQADLDAHHDQEMPVRQHAPAALNLSRFSFNSDHAGGSTSSPFEQPLPSSPAFSASQRRPVAYDPSHGELLGPPRYLEYAAESRSTCPAQFRTQGSAGNQPRTHMPMQQDFRPSYAASQPTLRPKQIQSGPPVVQGINLVSTHELPDRFRAIFPYPLFNAVQSKSFSTIYKSNDNFVLSAPTGSGKTAVLELAVCRMLNNFSNGTFKIVYQAPTKSLCAERQRDWQSKFGPLDLQCAELTGDTESTQLRNVQNASIIITTPEKWDSVTRKWKDHQKLMQMVKLFLIDEVHILKEDRGATLEAVVSRMKSVGSNVRFVALSATVPNFQDIAAWLGKDPMNTHLPAIKERFGEEFRPVRLEKHVCGYQSPGNEFAFDKVLGSKLPEVIKKYSHRKPIMVFCITRASCVETAKQLATWWSSNSPKERYWTAPRYSIVVGEKDLKTTVASGVAFHHAGLQIQDRNAIEKGYLEGEVNVICCTSTLAVGVNLPCHMVIIKNTVTYSTNGIKEYSDLEIMQMLGRAGRPQFDDSAVAVIMTTSQQVKHYDNMITGEEILESCLHRNLIDHLNAEIGLGTIDNASSAKRWLSGTFLYVRLKENPEHYKLPGDYPGHNLDDRLETICRKGIALLEQHDLVKSTPKLHSTEFGDAMARYYLQFDTMKVILALPPKAKISEILSAVAQAAEFKHIRFRSGEKGVYKDLNKNSSIKFAIPVNIDQPAHKVSLIIQAALGSIEIPSDDYRITNEHQTAKSTIFQHAHRLVRCIVDCQLYLDDAITTRNALMLARSLAAQVWDDSPLHMKQLHGVGPVAVRKLAAADITSIEEIGDTDARRLEQLLSRNPPFGAQVQERARLFPRLRVSLNLVGEHIIKKGVHVTVRVKAELGFLNDKSPEVFQRRPVYVCLLADTSDGNLVHFARISAKKLGKGQDVLFSANLTAASQSIRAQVMCDEIAGTARSVILKPHIPPSAFPPPKTAEAMNARKGQVVHAPNTSKRRASADRARTDADDEFGDAGIDDSDMAMAEGDAFVDIEDLTEMNTEPKAKRQKRSNSAQHTADYEPRQLPNGKWACNHACKDKTACKHLCCREGTDKKPKPPKPKDTKKQGSDLASDPKQTQLSMGKSRIATSTIKKVDAKLDAPRKGAKKSRVTQNLHRLHDSIITSAAKILLLPTATSTSGASSLSFLPAVAASSTRRAGQYSSDYGAGTWNTDDLADLDHGPLGTQAAHRMSPPRARGNDNVFEDDMLDADFADVDTLAESQPPNENNDDGFVDFSAYTNDIGGLAKHEQDSFEIDARPSQASGTPPSANKAERHGIFLMDTFDHADPLNKMHEHDAIEATGYGEHNNTAGRTALPSAEKTTITSPSFEDAVAPIVEAATSAEEAADQVEEPPSSGDEVEKWFKAEFGTEYFNYVR